METCWVPSRSRLSTRTPRSPTMRNGLAEREPTDELAAVVVAAEPDRAPRVTKCRCCRDELGAASNLDRRDVGLGGQGQEHDHAEKKSQCAQSRDPDSSPSERRLYKSRRRTERQPALGAAAPRDGTHVEARHTAPLVCRQGPRLSRDPWLCARRRGANTRHPASLTWTSR